MNGCSSPLPFQHAESHTTENETYEEFVVVTVIQGDKIKTLRAEVTTFLLAHREAFEGESSSEEMMRRGWGRRGCERLQSVICRQATPAKIMKP